MKTVFELTPISKLGELGTGRNRNTVFVTDEDLRVLYKTEVRHNWPSKNIVWFSSGKVYDHGTQTIEGMKVMLYHWSLLLEVEWQKQEPMKTFKSFLNTGSLQQMVALRLKKSMNFRGAPSNETIKQGGSYLVIRTLTTNSQLRSMRGSRCSTHGIFDSWPVLLRPSTLIIGFTTAQRVLRECAYRSGI